MRLLRMHPQLPSRRGSQTDAIDGYVGEMKLIAVVVVMRITALLKRRMRMLAGFYLWQSWLW